MRIAYVFAATLMFLMNSAAAQDNPATSGKISGRLVSKDGSPLADVRVAAMPMPDPAMPTDGTLTLVSIAKTDAAGRYRLENIPPGDYFVTAGFITAPTYYPGVATQAGAKAVSVTGGSTREDVDFTSLSATSLGGSISGKVDLSSTSSTTARFEVRLSGLGVQLQIPLATDGTFSTPNLSPGNYLLRVVQTALNREPPLPVSTSVVVADGNVTDVRLALPYSTSVSGRVVTDDGTPFQLPGVMVSTKRLNATGSTSISRDGFFTVHLVEGENQIGLADYPVTVSVKSINYDGREWPSGLLRFDRTMKGDVLIIVKVSPMDAVKGVTVRGKAENIPAEFIHKAVVMHLYNRGGGPSLETPIDVASGAFEFQRVPAGQYILKSIGPLNSAAPADFLVRDADQLDVKFDFQNNPFPEFPGAAISPIFDSSRSIELEGRIVQEVTLFRPSAAARYFRMDVTDQGTGKTTRWAVLTNSTTGGGPTDPENAKLQIGRAVSVRCYPDRDGSPRCYLVPQTGPGTAIGVMLRNSQ